MSDEGDRSCEETALSNPTFALALGDILEALGYERSCEVTDIPWLLEEIAAQLWHKDKLFLQIAEELEAMRDVLADIELLDKERAKQMDYGRNIPRWDG